MTEQTFRSHQHRNQHIHDNLLQSVEEIVNAVVIPNVWEIAEVSGNDTVRYNSLNPLITFTEDFLAANAESEGAGNRVFLDKLTGAFRAGTQTGTTWNLANRGISSVALGEDSTASGQYSTVSGGQSNSATGAHTFVGGGRGNVASRSLAVCVGGEDCVSDGVRGFVGGGLACRITGGGNAADSFVGAGEDNIILAEGQQSAIVGGLSNRIGNETGGQAFFSFIGSGAFNRIVGVNGNNAADSSYSVICGGGAGGLLANGNSVLNATQAFIGGGLRNIISGGTNSTLTRQQVICGGDTNTCSGDTSCILGGFTNSIDIDSPFSTIIGGRLNSIVDSDFSAILGGTENTVTTSLYGIACGDTAAVSHDRSFVWSGSSAGATSNGVGTFTMTFGGAAERGLYLVDNPAGAGTNLVISGDRVLLDTSSIRFKKNVRDLEYNATFIEKIRPVRFKWKKGDGRPTNEAVGFIAEEVNEFLPETVPKDANNLPHSVNWQGVVAALVMEVKQLRKEVKQLKVSSVRNKKEITALKEKLNVKESVVKE